MKSNKLIRPYTENDFEKCVEIINRVWGFDARFQPDQLARLFKNIYVSGSLSASNFYIVIEENNTVEGFLFGKCGHQNLYKSGFSTIVSNLAFIYRLLTLKQVPWKRKTDYLKMLNDHEIKRREIEPKRINEVNLFAVDPKNQGKGYGKKLMEAYIEFCRSNDADRVTLETDLECNYGFYQHFGFKVKGEFYSALQKEYSGKSGQSYIYELIL